MIFFFFSRTDIEIDTLTCSLIASNIFLALALKCYECGVLQYFIMIVDENKVNLEPCL